MEQQMNNVAQHLEFIIINLVEIEACLGGAKKAQEKFQKYEEKKREKMARRLRQRSKELVKACRDYLTVTRTQPQLN
jgi:hypothetical protein